MTVSSCPQPACSPALSSNQSTLRIVVADALTVFRHARLAVLEAEVGFSVVGVGCDGAEVVQSVLEYRPHVLLVDLAMPRAGGLDALRQVRDSAPGVRVVVLVEVMTSTEVVTALTLGARGVVLEDALPSELCDCVWAVAQGDYWVGNGRVSDVVDALHRVRTAAAPVPVDTLMPHELEIAVAVLLGATNRDISRSLSVSIRAVETMLSNVFNKVGVSSRFELALYAARHRLDDESHGPQPARLHQEPWPRRQLATSHRQPAADRHPAVAAR
jgi:two-component system nitrate/nitrite response regulator NarL